MFEPIGAAVSHFEQKGGGAAVDEEGYLLVYVLALQCPAKALGKGVELPQSLVVAACSYNRLCACRACHVGSQAVGSTNVSRCHGNGVACRSVEAHHGGVVVLVGKQWCDSAHADAEG